MNKSLDIYVNENFGYDINSNQKYIEKQDIVNNFIRAYQFDGCKNILRSKDEQEIKFTAKFDTFNDYNVIIPMSTKNANKEFIKQINFIYRQMQLKRKEINKVRIKKVFVGASMVLAGLFVIEKATPVVKNIYDTIIEIKNIITDDEPVISNSSNEISDPIRRKEYSQALEQIELEKEEERKELEQEGIKEQQSIDAFNQEQEQKMIDDMKEYRNLDTMPNVERTR